MDNEEATPEPQTKQVHVYFVIDDSGSMQTFQHEVRKGITQMVSTTRNAPGFRYHYKYIGFSHDAVFSEELSQLPLQCSSTNIAAAFKLLNRKVVSSPVPDKYMVVFISDGADDDPMTIVDRLQKLGGIKGMQGTPTVLFTVAVCNAFPTKVVVDALRPNYHSGSDCLPLVFPIQAPAQCSSVFEKLALYMFERDHFKDTLSFDANTPLEALVEGVDSVYNFCTLKCAHEADQAKCLQYLQEAKLLLGHMLTLAVRLEEETRQEVAPGLANETTKPLASKLLAAAKKEKKEAQTSINETLTRINQYIDDTAKGQLISKLSDKDKQAVLSYGNLAGRHLVKSLRYHSADISETLRSLKETLLEYDDEQAEADAQVSDVIITQREALLDAQTCVQAIVDNSDSLVGVIQVLALVGRLLDVRICSGTQINPFLVEVVGIPPVLSRLNSVDFFTRYNGVYTDDHRGESANCLMPITRNPSPKNLLRRPCGMHLSTYFLCKNVELKFPMALLGMQAATVTHCLANGPTEWLQGVLDETYESATCVYGDPTHFRHWAAYVKRAGTPKFRHCLVTSSDDLPSECTCEHLTKFVMALYVLIRGGRRFTLQEFLELRDAVMVETMGRETATGERFVDKFFTYTPKKTSAELLASVPLDQASMAYTLPEAITTFETDVKEAINHTNPDCDVHVSINTSPNAKYFQFTTTSVPNIFRGLYNEQRRLDQQQQARGQQQAREQARGQQREEQQREDQQARDQQERDQQQREEQEHGAFEFGPVHLLKLAQHAYSGSSYERNVLHPEVMDVDMAVVKNALIRQHVKHTHGAAKELVTTEHIKHQQQTHRLARQLPPQYLARYKSETGRDPATDLNVSQETWLPLIACSCPGCPYFLHTKGNKRVSTKDGVPRIADTLKSHISTIGVIEGLHRGTRLLATISQAAVVAGAQRDVRLRRGAAMTVQPGDIKVSTKIKDLVLQGKHLLDCAPVDEARKIAQIGQAITHVDESDTPEDCIHLIEEVQGLYESPEEIWTYEEFKATLDARYDNGHIV